MRKFNSPETKHYCKKQMDSPEVEFHRKMFRGDFKLMSNLKLTHYLLYPRRYKVLTNQDL